MRRGSDHDELRPHAHTPTRPHAHTPTRPHAHTPTRPHEHPAWRQVDISHTRPVTSRTCSHGWFRNCLGGTPRTSRKG
ncbi:hypothetical protein CK936_21435 [Streptomyces albireticuli]|uniref:Uncharacterized protein n=1 Tax=Streptomyces albireticuli TaxID=1940 RepID=A0A2A2D5S7_9ACTN|nr:hypothetical protein CK936_21435 [Streptomyces albireticuli]